MQPLTGTLTRISSSACRPVDGASAAAFRVAFGLLGLVGVIRVFARGWIDDLYVQPAHHFKYIGFEWIQPLPGWGMYALFATLGILALCVAVGFRYRLSVALFFIGFTYVELIDKATYLNHYYWVSLVSLLMIFMPLDRVASVDAWRNPSSRRDTVPAWTIWALRAQIGAVYFFAGVAKFNPDWLLEAQPMRIWLYQHGDMPLFGALLQQAWTAYAMSWAGALFDLTIVGWLLWYRSRPLAYIALVAFHIATWALFPKIGMFPWLMMGATPIFFSASWPRNALDFMRRGIGFAFQPSAAGFKPTPAKSCPKTENSQLTIGNCSRILLAALALFALALALLPLRHLAYPGNVRWNEEGYRYSWRVMLTEKVGSVQYRVKHPPSGQAWLVYPHEYLTPTQTERMAIHPDMILETAHIVADDFKQRGYPGVEVRADAFVAMNGRANRRLIDPDVDLARVSHGIAPKRWIIPMR